MNIRLQIIIAIILIIALCVIVNMIRKKRLELRYALAWLIVGVSGDYICTYSCDFKSINQNETVDTGIGVV